MTGWHHGRGLKSSDTRLVIWCHHVGQQSAIWLIDTPDIIVLIIINFWLETISNFYRNPTPWNDKIVFVGCRLHGYCVLISWNNLYHGGLDNICLHPTVIKLAPSLISSHFSPWFIIVTLIKLMAISYQNRFHSLVPWPLHSAVLLCASLNQTQSTLGLIIIKHTNSRLMSAAKENFALVPYNLTTYSIIINLLNWEA